MQVVITFKIEVHLAYSTHTVIFIATNRPLYIWWWTFCFHKSETADKLQRCYIAKGWKLFFSFYCFGNYTTLLPGIVLKFTGLSASYILCHEDNVPIPVAAWPKALAWTPFACWDCRFESRRGLGCLSLVIVVCCTGRSLCDEPIPQTGDSYRVCMCQSVISYSSSLRHLQLVGRRGPTKKEQDNQDFVLSTTSHKIASL